MLEPKIYKWMIVDHDAIRTTLLGDEQPVLFDFPELPFVPRVGEHIRPCDSMRQLESGAVEATGPGKVVYRVTGVMYDFDEHTGCAVGIIYVVDEEAYERRAGPVRNRAAKPHPLKERETDLREYVILKTVDTLHGKSLGGPLQVSSRRLFHQDVVFDCLSVGAGVGLYRSEEDSSTRAVLLPKGRQWLDEIERENPEWKDWWDEAEEDPESARNPFSLWKSSGCYATPSDQG